MINRRTYLGSIAVACLTASAGCGGDDGGDGGGTTTDAPPTTETTTSPTTTETETPSTPAEPAEFIVETIDTPDSVNVGEEHTISVAVRNTDGESGAYQATLEYSVESSIAWEDFATIELTDVPPGETATWTSDPISVDEESQLQFRIASADVQVSYSVTLPSPSFAVGDASLETVDLGYETVRMAEFSVRNTGEYPIGQVELTVDWYDSGGSYLASSDGFIHAVRPGETWQPRVDPSFDVDNPEEIESAEASASGANITTALDPEGVTVVDSMLLASSEEVRARATIRNERETSLDYTSAVAKVYNSVGNVIGSVRANESDLPAGAEYSFDRQVRTRGRSGAAESLTVEVTDNSLLF